MQKRQKLKIKHNTIGYTALSSLAFLTLLTIYPMSSTFTSATSTATTDIDAVVEPFLSVSASPNVTINTSGTETLSTNRANVSVSTNSREGYSLYLSTIGKDNSLHSDSKDNLSVISPVAANSTASTFENNSWGYNLAESGTDATDSYNPVPNVIDVAVPVTTTSENSIKNYNLTFATKIDASLPADTYSNSVLISAIANPIAAANLNELNYMQGMTPEICENTMDYQDIDHYVERKLVDIRDGKSYYVAKLADGNCWMTQNLDLDLSTKHTLTNVDTDLNSVSSWTPEHDTSTEVPEKVDNPSYTEDLSWDMGDYVLATPQRGVGCGINNDSILPGQTFEQCADFQNVQGWTPGNITSTEWNGYTGLIAVDKTSKTYNPHYLIGNYYQWNAATAGSGIKTNEENKNNANLDEPIDAKDSICPKGWKLPVAGKDATANWPLNRESSFYKLLKAYGYRETGSSTPDSSLSATEWVLGDGNNIYTKIMGPEKIRVDDAPIYIVRSGYVHILNGLMRNVGFGGCLCPPTASDSHLTSFDFYFNSTNVYPSYNSRRYYGTSVRCLAR